MSIICIIITLKLSFRLRIYLKKNIAFRNFNNFMHKGSFVISVMFEAKQKDKLLLIDTVFFKFNKKHQNNTSTIINLSGNLNDLFKFVVGLDELIEIANVKYRESFFTSYSHTANSAYSNQTELTKSFKKISLGYSPKNNNGPAKYFVNAEQSGDRISFAYDKYEIRMIRKIADEICKSSLELYNNSYATLQ